MALLLNNNVMTRRQLETIKRKYLKEGYKIGLLEARNTRSIKDGDICWFDDGEYGVVDFAFRCDDAGCYADALGVKFDWPSVTLLMTEEEFQAKIR